MVDLGSAVGYLMLDTSGFQGGFKSAQQQMKTFFDSTSSAKDRMTALSGAMNTVGTGLTTYVTTPLVGAGAAALYAAGDFEKALSSIETNTGSTAERMEELQGVLESIYTRNFGEDYQDIADSISLVDQQLKGLSPDSLQYVTEAALTLRDTMEYDVRESVRAADSLMTNFGLNAEEAFDYIAYGAQNGLDWSDELLDTVNEYSPQFKKLGLDAEDMFISFANGAEAGAWNLDKIGDAMKEFSIRVIDGSETTAVAFETIGLSADDMAYKFGQGGETAKKALAETIEALEAVEDPVAQNIAGVGLFGTMWEDLGPEVVLQLADIENGAIDASDAMKQMQESEYDNLFSDLETLKRSFVDLGRELGEYFLPKTREAVQGVTDMVNSFKELDPATQEMIISVGVAAAAFGPLLLVGSKIISGITLIQGLLPALGTVIGALSGPIGIVVAGVALLAAAWTTNFAGIRDTTQEIMSSVASIIDSVWGLITSAWEEDLLGIRTIVEAWWTSLEVYWRMVFDTISGIFKAFSQVFQGDWEGAWETVKETFHGIWDSVVELLDTFFETIISLIVGLAYNLYSSARNTFNKIQEAFKNVWDSIMGWFNTAKEDPVKAILGLATSLYDAGRDIFNSLWDGLKFVWDSITGWIGDAVDWIIEKVNFFGDEWNELDSKKQSAERQTASRVAGSYASGLDYVPRDMLVKVHEGERILTKQENQEGSYGNVVPAKLQVNITFTQPVDTTTAKRVSKEIAKDTERQLRGKGVVLV